MFRARLLALAAVSILVGSAAIEGQQERRQQGGPPPYDPKAEVTISGSVVGTEMITPPDRPEQLILMLTVEGAPMAIILGPSEWVTRQNFVFTKDAKAEVVGNKGFKFNGHPAMYARTVKVGNKTLTIRDQTGKAGWDK